MWLQQHCELEQLLVLRKPVVLVEHGALLGGMVHAGNADVLFPGSKLSYLAGPSLIVISSDAILAGGNLAAAGNSEMQLWVLGYGITGITSQEQGQGVGGKAGGPAVMERQHQQHLQELNQHQPLHQQEQFLLRQQTPFSLRCEPPPRVSQVRPGPDQHRSSLCSSGSTCRFRV